MFLSWGFFVCLFYYVCMGAQSLESCPILCSLMDCSPPGSSVHRILQARILEWVAMPFPRGSSQPWDQTQVSCIEGGFFTSWATRETTREAPHPQFINQESKFLQGSCCPISQIWAWRSAATLWTLPATATLKPLVLEWHSENESRSVVSDSATPWTIQSLEFYRPEYWNRPSRNILGEVSEKVFTPGQLSRGQF